MITFLAATRAGAIAAPLNPAYTVDEFEFFMSDAESQFVVVGENSAAAVQAASKVGIPVIVSKINES